MQLSELFTLVVPTKDRQWFLPRFIEYYKDCGFNVHIYDASPQIFETSISAENIHYFHKPNKAYCDKLNDAFRKVNTKYACLGAEDDFIVPDAIHDCITFLQLNQDYISAQGEWISFERRNGQILKKPKHVDGNRLDVCNNKYQDRLKLLFENYTPLYYCVSETSHFKNLFADCVNVKSLNLLEILMVYYFLIFGKHKVINRFYGAREVVTPTAGLSEAPMDMYLRNAEEFRLGVKIIESWLDRKGDRNSSKTLNSSLNYYFAHRKGRRARMARKSFGIYSRINFQVLHWKRRLFGRKKNDQLDQKNYASYYSSDDWIRISNLIQLFDDSTE